MTSSLQGGEGCRGEGGSTGGGDRKVMVVHHVGQSSSAGSPLSTLRGKVSGWEGAGRSCLASAVWPHSGTLALL